MEKVALVLSGGGCKGAYSVGALRHMLLGAAAGGMELTFDIAVGTSTGSLIAPLALVKRIDVLQEVYTNVSTPDIVKGVGLADALLHRDSIYDSEPLREIAERTYTDAVWQQIHASGKQLIIVTVDLLSGEVVNFFTGARPEGKANCVEITSKQMMIDAVIASADMPVFTPVVRVEGQAGKFVDGGVRSYIGLSIALDAGATSLYAIATSPEAPSRRSQNEIGGILSVAFRTLDLLETEVYASNMAAGRARTQFANYILSVRAALAATGGLSEQTIERCMAPDNVPNPLAALRAVRMFPLVCPEGDLVQQLHLSSNLDFDPDAMTQMMALGEADAARILEGSAPSPFYA